MIRGEAQPLLLTPCPVHTALLWTLVVTDAARLAPGEPCVWKGRQIWMGYASMHLKRTTTVRYIRVVAELCPGYQLLGATPPVLWIGSDL